ncbi:hypothetical protein CAMSH0001_1353 [Campylobacter showae RM3277]|uniref:Uncharacterized protein n=1 Tax=Campylobacter showae RM3277 TaxID=553219 RepID=C6RIK6_9BACT|nr:hypothetical protein CAMSH0001_1353 [Campylobacter showae RM3277]
MLLGRRKWDFVKFCVKIYFKKVNLTPCGILYLFCLRRPL